MSNPEEFESRGNPWGYSRFAPTEFPDQGGPIARPYNPKFTDAPKPKSPGRPWRLMHQIKTVKAYSHKVVVDDDVMNRVRNNWIKE